MSNTNPFTMTITNPNAITTDEDTSAIVYLISARDDETNELVLTITNVTGGPLKFNSQTPISVSMKEVLPADVIRNMQVQDPLPDGWTWSVHSVREAAQGIDLTPTKDVSVGDQPLTFIFVNIVFTAAEVQQGGSALSDFKVSYSVPSQGVVPLKVMVTPVVDRPKFLTHFTADLIPVPADQGWNVEFNQEKMMIKKDNPTVYSNSIPNMPIRTRLAFRLTNQDSTYALNLNTQSVFKVSFLPGDGYGQLANSQDLLNNISIKEIISNDNSNWIISAPSGDGAIEWTLTPKNDQVSLAKNGGYCDFLIDAVLANGLPSDPKAGAATTEMYILYTKVPSRIDKGSYYDDGYLATDILKIVPVPQVLSFDREPTQDHDPLDVGTQINLSWSMFGINNPTLDYTDYDDTPRSIPVDPVGQRQVYPPGYIQQPRTTTYQLKSGNNVLREISAKTKPLADLLLGKWKYLFPQDQPATVSLTDNGTFSQTFTFKAGLAVIAFKSATTCSMHFSLTPVTDNFYFSNPGWDVDGTYSITPKDDTTFVIKFTSDVLKTYEIWEAPLQKRITVNGSIAFSLTVSVKEVNQPVFTTGDTSGTSLLFWLDDWLITMWVGGADDDGQMLQSNAQWKYSDVNDPSGS